MSGSIVRRGRRAVLVVALGGALPLGLAGQEADLVLSGGRVFTGDPARPFAEGLAIRGDRILAVGTDAEVLALAGAGTRRIPLGGRTVVPGFNDAHAHPGAPLPGVAFSTGGGPVPDPPLAVVLDSLAALAARHPAGTWLRTAVDATLLDDPHARRAALDSVAPRHPVWLGANTGHGAIVNTAALAALGIDGAAADPAGGFFERSGVPYPGRGAGPVTGLLHEYAAWNAARRLQAARPAEVHAEALRAYGAAAVALGITSVQHIPLWTDGETALSAHRAAGVPLRVRLVPMPGTREGGRRTEEWEALRAAPEPPAAVSGVKWILDGTGIERLALMRAPYADRPGFHGMANFPGDTLRAILAEALAAGEQPVLHAIGDSAILLVLGAMESLAPDSAWRRLRPRLEHAEWLVPELRERARRLGVVVVQNPLHFTDPPELVAARFGARGGAYQPFASLVREGIPVAIGSDGPMDPFLNLLFAVTHPVNPGEAMRMEEAVSAYTRGSAYAEHREHEKGVLAPGMLADLAVLSRDIFAIPADDLPGTRSLLTLVGGRIVHEAPGPGPAARATHGPRSAGCMD